MSEHPVSGNSLAAKAWRTYGAQASVAGESQMVEQHLSLVKTVVGRLRLTLPTTLDLDDLYSVGVTGLISAARRYDPSRNTAFTAFASQHIRGAVLDELRRMDYMSRGAREKAHKVTEAINSVEQRTQQPATAAEVSAELGLSVEQYESLLDEVTPASFLPLDAEAFGENSDDVALHEMIADEAQLSARDHLEKKELLQLVMQRIQQLPDMSRKILAMYYFEELRISEIAAAFGLTEGRISQIHTQAVLSLRAFIRRITNPSPASSQCC